MSIKLYDHPLSGHGHRARALLQLLGLEYENIFIDLAKGEHKSEAFSKVNPLGQVPVFVDGEFTIRESTAILIYLAKKYDKTGQWLPDSPELASQVQSWLAVSTKEIYEGPFLARMVKVLGAPFDHNAAVEKAHAIFTQLFEPHLSVHKWLVGNAPTIADISNYGYIAAAGEGEIDMSQYPNISAWIARIENIDSFPKMAVAAEIMG